MKRALVIGITVVALGAGAMLNAQSPRSADVQMKAAQQKAEVEGDLKGAIEEYKKVVAAAGSNRALAAQALVRMAECYQKLGDAESRRESTNGSCASSLINLNRLPSHEHGSAARRRRRAQV